MGPPDTTTSRQWIAIGTLTVATLLVSACAASTAEQRSDAGRIRGLEQPAKAEIAAITLPDAANSDAEFPLRAAPGGLLLVYFGYTHCPDICPGTLAGFKLAIRKLTPAQRARVQVAMVTVDPTRDTGPVLTEYLRRFFPDPHALRTEDPARLAAAAAPFGVRYEVATNAKGEEDVGHSALSFAVDDGGRVAVSLPYGFAVSSIAHDLRILARSSSRT